MTVTTLGRVNVITPGTLVPLSTDPNQRVARIFAQVIPGLTGKGYLGTSNMVRATLAGVTQLHGPAGPSPGRMKKGSALFRD